MFVFRSPDLVIRGVLWFGCFTSIPHTPLGIQFIQSCFSDVWKHSDCGTAHVTVTISTDCAKR